MPARKVTDEQLREALAETNSPAAIGRKFNMHPRAVSLRLRKMGVPPLESWRAATAPTPYRSKAAGWLEFNIEDGTILVGSDAHYWPGIVTTAHRAFVEMCKRLQPKIVILNGDVFDGASVSRHARLGWGEKPPGVQEELRTVEARLDEITAACRPGTVFVWLRGNHCQRFEISLAANSPQFEGVQGFSLSDHFPRWKHGMAARVNDRCVIKHRHKGGIHATYQNTLQSGVNLVTGHLHRLTVTTYSDYNGTRWGVDCGTLADPEGPQFTYTELGPTNWASGFAVLSFRGSRLLYPELVHVIDEGVVSFRGDVIDLNDRSAADRKARKQVA